MLFLRLRCECFESGNRISAHLGDIWHVTHARLLQTMEEALRQQACVQGIQEGRQIKDKMDAVTTHIKSDKNLDTIDKRK